jgi:hypothetical protein
MPKTSSGRWLAGIIAAVVILALASVVVTLLVDRQVEMLPEGSPERAVQNYLLAVRDREYATAYALISPQLQENCTLEDFERSFGFRNESGIRVRLDDVRLTSTGAEVSVRVTEVYASGPFPSESTFTQRYFLTQVDGNWRLRELGWPNWGCYPDRPIPAPEPTPTPTPTPTPAPATES